MWVPVMVYLSEVTGDSYFFKTAPDIPTFEKRMADGAYWVAYMNPYHYTVFHAAAGYQALVREKNARIEGILVVRQDSPIREIKELAGQTVAFPAPAAFAASVLPRAYFKQHGIAIIPRYVASHDSVYRAVAAGLFPAGGGIVQTFQKIDPAVSDQLRIFWHTPGYTPHAIAIHPRMPAAAAARLKAALLALDETDRGRELLRRINFNGFEAATDSDWNDVRALEIQQLDGLLGADSNRPSP